MDDKGMNILLVYPEIPRTFWSYKYVLELTLFQKSTHPPLGLLTVSSLLPDNWNKKLIDMNVDKLKDKDIEWADFVFISATSAQRENLNEVISRCKELNATMVGGGPLFTTSPEDFKDVDYLVLNEAELTLPEFIDDVYNDDLKRIYTSDEWADITQTPIPDWNLINMKRYISMNIQYSRGCPFDCDFCDVTKLFGRCVRTKSKEQVIEELNALDDCGWSRGIMFVDDNFIGNKLKLKREILPAIIEWKEEQNTRSSFLTQVSIDIVDDEELMEMMNVAGFSKLFIGIETPNDESLAECNKFQNRERDLVNSVQTIQSYGFQVMGGFIVGFDSDPPTIFNKIVDFIQRSGIVTAMVGILNVVDGTKLYKKLEEQNRLYKKTSGNNTDLTVNYKPKMGIEKLVEGYKSIVKTIYSPKEFYKRLEIFINDFKPKLTKERLSFSYTMAFFKFLLKVAILGKEKWYFWKMLLKILIKSPRSAPTAIVLAIEGFHFKKIFERY